MEQELREFCEEILWQAKKQGAGYADCRVYPVIQSEEIKIENGILSGLNSAESAGFNVRVLQNGSWGFYSTPTLARKKIKEAVEHATRAAALNAALQKEKVELAPLADPWPREQVATFASPVEIDPFGISTEQKIIHLAGADEAMRQASAKAFWRIAQIALVKQRKIFASSDGILADQTFVESGAAVQAHAIAKKGGDTQRRSWPDSHLYYMQGGYEAIQKLNLVQEAARIAQEAEQLLEAKPAPAGKRGVILLPSMLNLHMHETTHGFEADRVLGCEWTLAGGSFLTPLLSEIGSFRFGSAKVNLVADSLTAGGVGTFGHDDEGTPGQRVPLVKDGVWVGLLTSRQAVPQLNKKIGRNYFAHSSGAMRGQDYGGWPVIRMVNILLEPGETDFDELKDSVPEGTVMFGTNKSWSIDDVRRHFTFGCEIAWEKKAGKWELRKNAKYYGDNLHFWRNCQAVCDQKSFWMQGMGSCGKADPLQTMHTGHGSSPAYFTDIQVGSVG